MSEWTREHERSRRLIEPYVLDWRYVNDRLFLPEYVYDRCHIETDRFLDWMLGRCSWASPSNLKPIYGFKFGDWLGKPVIMQAHVAVQFDDLVLDWTARQFDPKALVPRITTVEEFLAEWTPIPKE